MAASRTPFSPLSDKPQHHALYEHAQTLRFGDLISYPEILELTGTESRSPVYRTMRLLERNNQMTLICEPTVGYRIAQPAEHRTLTERHRKKSYRQIAKARSKARSADRSALTPDEQKWFDETELRLSQVEALTRNLHRRLGIIETRTEVHASSQTRVEAQLTEIREAMKAHGLLGELKAA